MTPEQEEFYSPESQLRREQDVIAAMQYRQSRWLTPVGYFLWRKPWKRPTHFSSGRTLGAKFGNLIGWLRFAHDCSNPAIGCSCHPSFRFPNPPE